MGHRRASGPAAETAPPPSALREQTVDQQVQHVLNRLAFGARPEDVDAVRRLGVDRWIAQQLQPERLADHATDSLLRRYRTLAYSADRLLAEFPPPAVALAAAVRRGDGPLTAVDSQRLRQQARQSGQALGELASSRVARAVLTERQLEEVLVDFWENHFNVFAGKDRTRYFLNDFDRTVRQHAMGDFRALLGAVAKSPAMLYYLDNWQSVADSGRPVLQPIPPQRAARRAQAVRRAVQPRGATSEQMARVEALQRRRRGLNENYARELMELHTLGVDGGYTQQDVVEVARALTGWTLERGAQGGGFVFRPQAHDAGAKTILGVRFPAGRGQEEGEAVLDLLAYHPRTAEFIARKLVQRFVSDSPPPALVARAAERFRLSRGNIRETVRTIVTSPEFFSADAYRAKVKSPFELVVSALRALDAAPDVTARTAQLVSRLGQPLFGHQAPNGYPETGEAWMNTGAILNRINFGLTVAGDRVPGVRLAQWPLYDSLRTLDRPAQVDGVIRALLGGAVSSDTRAVLILGRNPFLAARGGADALMALDGADSTDAPDPMTPAMRPRRRGNLAGSASTPTGLAQIVGLALGAPEFQRR
ncbi:DUF1800 domain-containing protein [Gemmatimonas sp.]|uniref:DUF1800 domain-containing protein n=1 Tax=Gemmatimonas sp. TaxID=1962908 RepID=UPI0022C2EE19|nr:DUF1800 domain-containing protein [Gemmatimonas sp.]MCZ8203991.1 DUF1800 domain-containing protein [Gemmatimonas sp.]